MSLSTIFFQLAISVGLGLLIGLQRESVESKPAGIRTFPLFTLLGTICALLSQSFGGWTIAAGFIALAILLVMSKSLEYKITNNKDTPSLTTEAALLLMFGVGAYLVVGYKEVAVAIGGITAVLLHFKAQLHGIVARLNQRDIRAIMQFALLSLVILPVLPNRTYGPYDVVNPYNVWLMICLIVGISLSGYIVYKFFGENAGVILGGVLGGLISSTATTVSYARRTKSAPDSSKQAAIVIMIANTIVFARLLIEIATVAPKFLMTAAPPLGSLFGLSLLLSAGFWLWGRKEKSEMPEQENPSELKSALFFGLLYAGVLLAVAAVKETFGNTGLYVVAAVSGLTDVDAITLSSARLVNNGGLNGDSAWRIIVTAIISNMIFKGGTVAALGHPRLLVKIGILYGITIAAAICLIFLWPSAA